MNEKIEIKPKFLPPFKRFCMTIGELPTSYVETMSYYEMLLWFTKYLGETVIPTIDNNAEAVKELQDLFIELQEYVNTYFDNLDISAEVDEKLDEMAESGELADIIAAYLNSRAILGFNTVAEMKLSENLNDGSFTRTYGTNDLHDGLGYFYKVREILNTDVIDEKNIIALSDPSLVAERISSYVIGDTKNPIYYGADPTGTNDSSQAINDCIQANKGSTIEFSIGTYLVNSTINLPYAESEKVNINGNGATLKNTTDLTRLIYVGFDKGSLTANNVGYPSYIKDLNIDGVDSDTTYCIDIISGYKDLKLFNLRIFRFLNGIRIGETTGTPADVLLTDSLVYGKGSEYDGTGVIANCTDNNIDMCRIYGFRTCFLINGTALITNTQGLLRWENQTSANYDPYVVNGTEWNQYYPLTSFAIVNSPCRIISSYADSMYNFVKLIRDTVELIVDDCLYYNARSSVDSRIIWTTTNAPIMNISNNTFYIRSYNEGSGIYNEAYYNNYAQISLANNSIRFISALTNPADKILSSLSEHSQHISNKPLNDGVWNVVGVLSNMSDYNTLNGLLFVGGWCYQLKLNGGANRSITTINQYNKASNDSPYSVGTVSTADVTYICIKRNGSNGNSKIRWKLLDSLSITFANVPVLNGSNVTDSSRLLSDYTSLVPTNETRLKDVQY